MSSTAQEPPTKRQRSSSSQPSDAPSASQQDVPICYRVVLETLPLTRRTLEIELDDLWSRYGLEYQIIGSSPNLTDMSLITHPVVEHPWMKFHPVSRVVLCRAKQLMSRVSLPIRNLPRWLLHNRTCRVRK